MAFCEPLLSPLDDDEEADEEDDAEVTAVAVVDAVLMEVVLAALLLLLLLSLLFDEADVSAVLYVANADGACGTKHNIARSTTSTTAQQRRHNSSRFAEIFTLERKRNRRAEANGSPINCDDDTRDNGLRAPQQ